MEARKVIHTGVETLLPVLGLKEHYLVIELLKKCHVFVHERIFCDSSKLTNKNEAFLSDKVTRINHVAVR